jgi:TRAP-type C4-dicarboxylate transport system permease small subunit
MLAGLVLLGMMLAVMADVIVRTIDPGMRFSGMLDMVEFSLDWVIFLAIPAALFAVPPIVVDLIDRVAPGPILTRLGQALTAGCLLVMGLAAIRPALAMLEWQERTFGLNILKFWYWMPIWLGLGLGCIAAIAKIFSRRDQ